MFNETKSNPFHPVFALVICLFFILLDSINSLSGVNSLVSYLSAPLKIVLHNTGQNFNDFANSIVNLSKIRDENLVLKEQVTQQTEIIIQLTKIQEENQDLKKQLGIEDLGDFNQIEARIIGGDPRIESFIIVNRGRTNNVKEGDVVVLGKYAIGEVVQTDDVSSKIRLINSPESNIPARTIQLDRDDGAKGLIKGSVNNSLEMQNILAGERIQQGDVVITTGVDSNYPFGLILGEVVNVSDISTDTTKRAQIKPLLDFRELDIVFIIQK